MTLTVLSVAFPFAPMGPDRTGGAEQIVSILDEAIDRAGHFSLVIAAEGSTSHGRLFPLRSPSGPIDEDGRRAVHRACRRLIDEVTRSFHVDVIHLHGVDFFEYLPGPGTPIVVTLHLPATFYPSDVFALSRARTHWVCVSESQRRTLPRTGLPIWSIENGVELTGLSPGMAKADYVVALGRICPEKGFHLAVDAAKLAGCNLLLGGEVFPYRDHRRYFDDVLAPRLDERRRFLGPLGRAQKADVLARARALAVPSLVPETSSLVAMEALGSGTPVVAYDIGALPDIVEHGKTGFIVSGVGEMAAAFAGVDAIDPSECRRTAEARFGVERMTRKYLDLYARVAAEPS